MFYDNICHVFFSSFFYNCDDIITTIYHIHRAVHLSLCPSICLFICLPLCDNLVVLLPYEICYFYKVLSEPVRTQINLYIYLDTSAWDLGIPRNAIVIVGLTYHNDVVAYLQEEEEERKQNSFITQKSKGLSQIILHIRIIALGLI